MAFKRRILPTFARAVIITGLAGLLITGCKSYFSEDWPKLTAPTTIINNPPQVTMSFVAPPALFRNTGNVPVATGTAPQQLTALAENFQTLNLGIKQQQVRYEAAVQQLKAMKAGEDRTQQWVTAQLELTRLSQISNGLDDILTGLDALLLPEPLEALPVEPAENLWDRVYQREEELNRYLKRQRLDLATLK